VITDRMWFVEPPLDSTLSLRRVLRRVLRWLQPSASMNSSWVTAATVDLGTVYRSLETSLRKSVPRKALVKSKRL